mmetsp:Transcript_16748/g.24347  ORF Transcript_16748/g.24347 Transcript_16748/m.24347 type:complete len:405 (+) Transcript_16748:1-1215(+)
MRQSIEDAINAIVQYLTDPSLLLLVRNMYDKYGDDDNDDGDDDHTSTNYLLDEQRKKELMGIKTAIMCYPAFCFYLQNVDIFSLHDHGNNIAEEGRGGSESSTMMEALKNGFIVCHCWLAQHQKCCTYTSQDSANADKVGSNCGGATTMKRQNSKTIAYLNDTLEHGEKAMSSLLLCLSTILSSSSDVDRYVTIVQQTLMKNDSILASILFFMDHLFLTGFSNTESKLKRTTKTTARAESTERGEMVRSERTFTMLSLCLSAVKEWFRIKACCFSFQKSGETSQKIWLDRSVKEGECKVQIVTVFAKVESWLKNIMIMTHSSSSCLRGTHNNNGVNIWQGCNKEHELMVSLLSELLECYSVLKTISTDEIDDINGAKNDSVNDVDIDLIFEANHLLSKFDNSHR